MLEDIWGNGNAAALRIDDAACPRQVSCGIEKNYFSASEDEAYAGDQNFTSMTFKANLNNDTVGAEGTIAYLPVEGAENSVTAYYLYHDEEGVYFNTDAYFERLEIANQSAVTGIDYSCEVTFE